MVKSYILPSCKQWRRPLINNKLYTIAKIMVSDILQVLY